MPCTCCCLVALVPNFKDVFWNFGRKEAGGIYLNWFVLISYACWAFVWFRLDWMETTSIYKFYLKLEHALNSEANAVFTIRPREVK